MEELGRRDISRTHNLFVDVFKVYQESHNLLKEINEVIVQGDKRSYCTSEFRYGCLLWCFKMCRNCVRIWENGER